MELRARVYDWNGNLVTKDGALTYLQREHPDIYEEYWILGKTNPEAKRRAKPKVAELFEYASENDLYPLELFPHVQERLQEDREQGIARIVFSTLSAQAIHAQATRLGIRNELDYLVSLHEVMQRFTLPTAIKEDPEVYKCLALLLQEKGFDQLDAYEDDGLPRVLAAVTANKMLTDLGKKGFERVYHFDPEALVSPQVNANYTTIHDHLHLGR